MNAKDTTVTDPGPASPTADGSPSQPTCTIRETRSAGVTVLAVAGIIDAVTAPTLRTALNSPAHRTAHAVIVDLSAVDFLSSTGMGILFEAHADLSPAPLLVVADGPATSRPLTLIGMGDIIGLHPTLDEALAAVPAP